MSRAINSIAGVEDDSAAGLYRPAVDDSNRRLYIAVIFTTLEGTVAALRAAADLSRNLDMRITLFVAEVVPIHFSLDRPHVPIDFLERRSRFLVREAGIVDQEVKIQICLCRNRRRALQDMLARHSLILIGGRNQWWRRAERKLKKSLHNLGHNVIPVETRKQFHREAHSGRQDAFLRALEIMEMEGPPI